MSHLRGPSRRIDGDRALPYAQRTRLARACTRGLRDILDHRSNAQGRTMTQLDIVQPRRPRRPHLGRRRGDRVRPRRGARERRREGRRRGPHPGTLDEAVATDHGRRARRASRSPATRPTRPTPIGWSPRRSTGSAGSTSSINAVGGGAGKALHPAEAYPRDAWDWIMELNVRSTIVPTQAAARAMIEAGHGGAVLNISSVRANLGINAGYSAYVAAKGAISSLTRQWATEWAKHGIRVNAIMPTFVDTPQVATLLGDPDVQGRHRQPDPARPRRRDARPRRAGHLPRAPTPRRSSPARCSASTAA